MRWPTAAILDAARDFTLSIPGTTTDRQFAAALEHHKAGRLADAERLYRQVCAADPRHAAALHRLGVVAHQLGRSDAVTLLQRATALQPNVAEIHNDLGIVLAAQRQFAQAAASFTRAVTLKPDYAEAHCNRGLALGNLRRFAEASESFARALAVDPNLALAHAARGAALRELGRTADAVVHYRRAAALTPNFPGAHNNLANALMELGEPEEAVTHFDRAIALAPDFAPAHYNRGIALRGLSRIAEAGVSFKRALAIKPDFLQAQLAVCMARLPILYTDEAEIAQCRADYELSLRALRDAVEQMPSPGELADAIGAHQPFYLAYQGVNDRDLQAIYGAIVCRVMAARYGPARMTAPPAPGEPIRVGIVSGFFRRHSNWKIPIKGWLGQLDRRRFRLFGYYTAAEADAETETAAALCERFVRGPLSLDGWRDAILADAPHVMLYPEVGMDRVAAQLAAQRLAPVQCNAWGHPDTSGFPTLDYYLSSDLMEPPDGAQHYTEQLVRLPNLSIYYEPPRRRAGTARSRRARPAFRRHGVLVRPVAAQISAAVRSGACRASRARYRRLPIHLHPVRRRRADHRAVSRAARSRFRGVWPARGGSLRFSAAARAAKIRRRDRRLRRRPRQHRLVGLQLDPGKSRPRSPHRHLDRRADARPPRCRDPDHDGRAGNHHDESRRLCGGGSADRARRCLAIGAVRKDRPQQTSALSRPRLHRRLGGFFARAGAPRRRAVLTVIGLRRGMFEGRAARATAGDCG